MLPVNPSVQGGELSTALAQAGHQDVTQQVGYHSHYSNKGPVDGLDIWYGHIL
jgi:hypothetical protein